MSESLDDGSFTTLDNPSEHHSSRVRALFEWWVKRIDVSEKYPKWSDIDVIELKPWMGWLVVYDVPNILSDVAYRLVGTFVVQAAGYDLTGKKVSDSSYTLTPDRVLYNIKRIIDHGAACTQSEALIVRSTGSALSTDRLWLPFSEDGRSINRLLLYLDRIEHIPHHIRGEVSKDVK